MNAVIQVKDGTRNFVVVATIYRAVRQHVGWQSCRYKGRRYQVFGGIRNPDFIDVANPIKR